MNNKNLMQYRETTPQQRRENARKAGLASAEAKKAKKALKETLIELLELNPTDDAIKRIEKNVDIGDRQLNNSQAVALAQIARALKGDTRAAEFVRDTIGEKPSDKLDLDGEPFKVNISITEPSEKK